MGKASRTKGKAGELEFAHLLERYGLSARRGVQYAGGSDSPDVVCPDLPNVHWEVKRTEKFHLYKYLEQAIQDAGGDKMPIVAHRQSRQPWVAVVRMEDLMRLFHAAGLVAQPEPTATPTAIVEEIDLEVEL